MTDFFTRLAERTLGLAPSVQPMIASIYAPDPELGANGLFEIAVEEEYQDGDVTTPRAPTRSHPQPVSAPAPTGDEDAPVQSVALSQISETSGKMNGEEISQLRNVPDEFWQTKPPQGATPNPSPPLPLRETGANTPTSGGGRLSAPPIDDKQQVDIHVHNDTTVVTPP